MCNVLQRSTHISSKPNWQSIDTDIADSEVWIPMSVYPNVFFYSAVRAFCSDVDYNEVWILTNVHPNFFFCPAGKADGEVLRSKVWSLIVVHPPFLFLGHDFEKRQQVEYLTATSVDLRFESS